jgi:hypothetical protein
MTPGQRCDEIIRLIDEVLHGALDGEPPRPREAMVAPAGPRPTATGRLAGSGAGR